MADGRVIESRTERRKVPRDALREFNIRSGFTMGDGRGYC